jgi:hypothetical protein
VCPNCASRALRVAGARVWSIGAFAHSRWRVLLTWAQTGPRSSIPERRAAAAAAREIMNALVHRETCKLCNLVFSIRISRCAAKLCSDVIVRDSLDDRFHSAAVTELRRAPNGLDSSIWCAETSARPSGKV